jgi:dipeptidyl aminopeptidase/acylaminoacyl peptidase
MKKFLPFLLIWISIVTLQAQNDLLTPEKLWDFGRIGLEAVSPDGKWIVYGLTNYDLPENKGLRDLYIMPAEGGTAKKITAFKGSEYNVAWRPDGKKIGFLSGESGSAQLWEMNPDGSDLQQITNVEGGLNAYLYSPDGKNLLYTQDVKLEQTPNDLYPDLPKANARIIDDLMYRHWNAWSDYAFSHIFYLPYGNGKVSGTPKDILEGEPFDSPLNPFGGIDQIAWSPDGQKIAYTCKKTSGKDYAVSTNSDIYLYDLASGKTENVSEGMEGYDRGPAFSPDGKYLAWNSMERAGFESDRERIILMDLSSRNKEELTKGLDRDAEGIHWSADGKDIYFTTGEKATQQLAGINVKSRKFRLISSGRQNYYSMGVAGDHLIALRTTISSPAELWKVDIASGKQAQLTFINTEKLNALKMGKVEERWVKTTDDKDMQMWVIYPPDFDPAKKYPTILYCQGGPQSTVSQFFSYRWNFQLMAAAGYIVVAPNRRGLPSFGREWNDQISGDWGGQNMKDYLTAADAMAAEPFVDENRMGAVGASYGGYSVYWLAGNHEKRFKAFIAHCGLFNLESWYLSTEEMFFANWDLKGPYWDPARKQDYDKFSPHRFVQNWDTPILVVHGEKDFRVPVTEGMQAFQAAQLQDIPSRFLYFPEEGHWVLSPQNGVLWHRVFFDWLDRYVKEDGKN